ncbi:glucosamine-6-phosphate deaminase [Oikeobacillus pervagus]|uniref:Glucosamine-6-phosphate deaminase n=1 Tax=Oikeobacillus pervagus TaxID=1325931 RepID=A0AAJ1WJW1_9BACI|nr:glucosamine-6-phosphate deaminase [Oikeobacillus pervagus]MDQ0215938.1 glucosamine-6-phosphate deaminase [Oikeobacillus pervagus]
MNIIRVATYKDLSEKASQILLKQIKEKSNSVLGLATGGSVIGTYELLVEDHKKNKTPYNQIKTVNLDEYIGLKPNNPYSYHYFMNQYLFQHIDLLEQHTHVPKGVSDDFQNECHQYEQTIEQLGGIDLQLLGVGVNGHIGFNEPGTSFQSKTHIVDLSPSTIEVNSRFFNTIEEVPTKAITMGIQTIMNSKKIVLLASGKTKAPILKEILKGEVTENVPASVLNQHPDVTIIADEEALAN